MSGELKRVLCFHGFGQNEYRIHKALASLRSLYKNKIEFVTIEAPNKLPLMKINDEEVQTYCWFYFNKEDPLNVKWNDIFDKIDDESKLYGLDTSIEFITEYLKDNKFDYYLGFSQGSAFLSLLCQKRIITEAKKLIFVSGFYPLKLSNIKEKINIANQHLIGTADEIIGNEFSRQLADSLFTSPVITEHKGRHVIPKQKKLLEI